MRVILLSGTLLAGACSEVAQTTDAQSRQVEAARGPVSAQATIAPAQPMAGERISLVVTVEASADVQVRTPLLTIEDDAIGSFNVLQSDQTPDLPLEDGRRRWMQTLVLDTYETGDVSLPQLRVEYTDNRGTPAVDGWVQLPALDLAVTSALADGERQLRAMRDERPLPVSGVSPWWWMALPLSILLLTTTMWWMRRGSAAAMVPLTPAQRARRDLEHLEREGLLDVGNSEAYFARVADIVRRYLEDGMGLRAPRATTREFLEEAQRSSALQQDHRASLHRLLTLADLVKFARHTPDLNAGTQAMQTARSFVDETDLIETEHGPAEHSALGGAT
ncbi:MAG: hypothetical protein MK101_03435 [Phycisphaerales bacterium]|nr:hypothetical protein [Phycisphaerales bacterium]